jgi:hypothetical protein
LALADKIQAEFAVFESIADLKILKRHGERGEIIIVLSEMDEI